MGYWVDMEDPYVTYKPKYMESVWWLLKQIYDKGLLYKGYTIQPYSPKAGTGLSSHEVNQPGAYRDVTDTTIVAQFKTLPETLPSIFKRFWRYSYLSMDDNAMDFTFEYRFDSWAKNRLCFSKNFQSIYF